MIRLTRRRVIWAALALVAVFLLADGFITAPAHEVQTPGGTPVPATAYTSTDDVRWQPGVPSQSLAEISCRHLNGPQPACSASEIASAFPTLRQSDHTLFYVWTGCLDWSGHGDIIAWSGYNLEYFAATGSLVIHCYVATSWIHRFETLFGVVALPSYVLLAIPTMAMNAGTLHIREDDRLEHLVGDQSTEYDLATATVNGS